MRSILIVLALMCIAANPVSAVDNISDVKSLADLRKLPTWRTADGWDVRVAMADPGKEAGPYILIYCLAERKTKLDVQILSAPMRLRQT